MSRLQEMVNKTFLSEALSTSGVTPTQLFISISTYALELIEQSGKIYRSTFLPTGFLTFPFRGILRMV